MHNIEIKISRYRTGPSGVAGRSLSTRWMFATEPPELTATQVIPETAIAGRVRRIGALRGDSFE
jgi:hypothetical protein